MRLKSLILGCALALMPCAPAPAKEPAAAPVIEARPALWVARDADTTIYLFGTIHLLKPNMRWFQGPIRAAFDQADEVVLEVVEEDKAAAQASIASSALDPDGAPLSTR
ncbi:MAG: TraB/GumN family protein, partial [Sphingomonadales bacterium]|nr:TraB/GumN family protein [Sphingomonadales bacterium]